MLACRTYLNVFKLHLAASEQPATSPFPANVRLVASSHAHRHAILRVYIVASVCADRRARPSHLSLLARSRVVIITL